MNRDLLLAVFVVVLGAMGLYLMLPHTHVKARPRTVYAAGVGLAGLALLLFGLTWTAPGPWVSGLFFYACAFAAVAAGALTVTSRDPVHCALWFAAVVLATSGLFLLAGASFLAVGTVIVYAGAIIVTFLFVIMLAQLEGKADYDRAARIPFRATWTCFVLFLGVVWAVLSVRPEAPSAAPAAGPAVAARALVPAGGALRRTDELTPRTEAASRPGVAAVIDRAVRPTARLGVGSADGTTAEKPHVAGLGATLYTDHLLTVELAGALLFAALVGALAIAPKPPGPPDAPRPVAEVQEGVPTTVGV